MTHAYCKQRNLGGLIGPMKFSRLTGLLVFFTSLAFAAQSQAQFEDLPITIDVRFIEVNDNFFEQIGVDFDFTIENDQDVSEFGFRELNNNPLTILDIPVSLAQTRLESEGAVFPDPNANGPAETGGSISFTTDGNFDTIPRTSLRFDFRSGVTAPPGTAGRIQNQGVVALKLNIPLDVTGDILFEVEASFDADIVEPLDGKFGLGALIELSTSISDFRFFGSAQRFFYESDSLGPFGDLFSATNDFSRDMGVLQFRGALLTNSTRTAAARDG